MKRVTSAAVFAAVLAAATATRAQMPAAGGANPLSTSVKGMFDNIKRNITEASVKMPEEHYGFKPTPEVRSYGEIVGHLADANYLLCSRSKGEKNPNDGNSFEKKTAKADLVKALSDAVAYCDAVYTAATDASGLSLITVGEAPNQRQVPKVAPLIGNISHDNEHYGNLVTYLRLKGLVPPSTERAQMQR